MRHPIHLVRNFHVENLKNFYEKMKMQNINLDPQKKAKYISKKKKKKFYKENHKSQFSMNK